MDYAAVLNSCDEKAQRVGLPALTDTELIVVLVSWANFEIELGGLLAYFCNSASDHAAETVPALEVIGAKKAASALRAAMAKFPGGSPPTDRERRYLGWQQVSESLCALDAEFKGERPDVFSKLCAFIETHAAELSEHA